MEHRVYLKTVHLIYSAEHRCHCLGHAAIVTDSLETSVDMPIIEEVNKVLFEDKPAKEAVNDLMLRDRKMEHGNLGWED